MLFSEPLFSLASAKVRHFVKLTKKIQLFFIGNEKTLSVRCLWSVSAFSLDNKS